MVIWDVVVGHVIRDYMYSVGQMVCEQAYNTLHGHTGQTAWSD